ncbi:histidine--tRNA ligase [Porphyromonas sp. COT-239 OH1446]|uniref:histidine--tRNA ligase n=1 Tax=Porphyromonas sp. COT-239 OH1446 TaxID=1515613 RepID=UPI00052DFE65|nr:histidine--tRNA ligase [Porphyromonas sp. COT-239 OH1446]KGN71279.1 histidyl-tRNA synthase [Porphyromonas sp. COT-239 OH1446]
MQKPSIPKGMRDFGPIEMARRNYIFDTIRSVYALYGYQQIETPTMEQLSTLMGKYGEEGDRLLFRVLNSGDYLKGVSPEELENPQLNRLSAKLCEKGLRYDLTVPFARYVVMHRDEITLPFRRYQIQPVWRADRPQKGRYREFYQCDADVIGSTSLVNEVELLQIIDEVFRRLKLRTRILLNNRKILSGMAEVIGAADRLVDITVAIDKLDKIGQDKVNDELRSKGFDEETIARLQPLLELKGNNLDKLKELEVIFASSPTGLKGIEELRFILDRLESVELESELVVDLSLARGLSYYTGAILEVKALDASIGSISGGGRYDDLTGIFGMPGLSGVGISFGADRIYDVLEELSLFPEETSRGTELLFVNFSEQEEHYLIPLVARLRRRGLRVELYPESSKLKKQMNYANTLHIPFVALVGESERLSNTITLKNMATGEQHSLSEEELVVALRPE